MPAPVFLTQRQWFQSPILSLNNDKISVKTHYLIDQLLNYGTQLLELFFLLKKFVLYRYKTCVVSVSNTGKQLFFANQRFY